MMTCSFQSVHSKLCLAVVVPLVFSTTSQATAKDLQAGQITSLVDFKTKAGLKQLATEIDKNKNGKIDRSERAAYKTYLLNAMKSAKIGYGQQQIIRAKFTAILAKRAKQYRRAKQSAARKQAEKDYQLYQKQRAAYAQAMAREQYLRQQEEFYRAKRYGGTIIGRAYRSLRTGGRGSCKAN